MYAEFRLVLIFLPDTSEDKTGATYNTIYVMMIIKNNNNNSCEPVRKPIRN